ncbi:group II intron maturase-specific domain-containing protein [Orientia tsutsugamushi]
MQTVIRKIVKDNKMSTQAALIMMHNPIIKGWTAYHRHIID